MLERLAERNQFLLSKRSQFRIGLHQLGCRNVPLELPILLDFFNNGFEVIVFTGHVNEIRTFDAVHETVLKQLIPCIDVLQFLVVQHSCSSPVNAIDRNFIQLRNRAGSRGQFPTGMPRQCNFDPPRVRAILRP